MSKALIAGNWKMNGDRPFASELARAIAASGDLGCEFLLCPPYTSLETVAAALEGSSVALGAQDCHAETSGAFTGDISVEMLRESGCSHVIVGHSERRSGHHETDAIVQAKATAAQTGGLTAVICVGESLAQRESGAALEVVESQVVQSLPEGAETLNTVIAYEPIWAIGSGKIPTLEEISAVHRHIAGVLDREVGDGAGTAIRILYGGSVNAENAKEILACEGVGGALVGGASLKADSFLAIGQSCP